MSPDPQIDVAETADQLAARAAAFIAGRIVAAPGRFALNLSGGSTPRRVYACLGAEPLRGAIDWTRVDLFWGDERFVPADDARSNFRMTREALLDRLAAPGPRVHAPPVDSPSPEAAAAAYDRMLRAHYGADALDLRRPLFDLTLLGLGEDGHTASLFPGTPALAVRDRLAVAVTGAAPEPRISMTYPALGSSREIVFLVSGAAKKDILRRVLAGDAALPASAITTDGAIRVFVDRDAAPD